MDACRFDAAFPQTGIIQPERFITKEAALPVEFKTLCGDEWMALALTPQGDQMVSVIVARDEAVIVPLTAEGDVLFTVEPSPALGRDVLILPGGTIETDELALEAANRELQEEFGFRAARLDFLGRVQPWAKYLTTTAYLYLARDLTPSTLPGDEDYAIQVERARLDDFEALIESGRLEDARVIAALYLARRCLSGSGAQC